MAGDATSTPKMHNGAAEALRTLSLVCRSAVKAKTQTINQIRALLVSAPQAIRDAVRKADAAKCVAACAAVSQGAVSVALACLQTALRLLAKRWTALNDELRELDAQLARLTKKAAPRLLARFGVGPLTAATFLIAAGDNPTKLHSDAALAALCETVPYKPLRARFSGTDSIVAEIARPIMRCGPLQWFACKVTPVPGNMSHDGLAKDCLKRRFTAA